MITRWQDVLDIQLEIHSFLTSENGREFAEGWWGSQQGPDGERPGIDGLHTDEEIRQEARLWATFVGVGVFNAEGVYIDPDMMTVVEAAVAGFHGEPLIESDLITQCGLMVLPRAMTIRPLERGVPLGWSCAFWQVVPTGVALLLLHDQLEPDELDRRNPEHAQRIRKVTRWLPTHYAHWKWGEMHPNFASSSGAYDTQVQMQGIWRLLNQTLAVRTKERPPRGFLKRAQKAKLPTEHVTIVRLRRPRQEPEPGDPVIVHWSHRWVVGGHWRNQWYPSISMHRQIWISPYVKGPDELPLVVNKARIFALVR